MDAEKLRKEYERTHAMLEWLAKRYVRDVSCHRCPARLSVCSQQKRRTTCSALIIEAAELATQKTGEQDAD